MCVCTYIGLKKLAEDFESWPMSKAEEEEEKEEKLRKMRAEEKRQQEDYRMKVRVRFIYALSFTQLPAGLMVHNAMLLVLCFI